MKNPEKKRTVWFYIHKIIEYAKQLCQKAGQGKGEGTEEHKGPSWEW